jgi:hypothetical protein
MIKVCENWHRAQESVDPFREGQRLFWLIAVVDLTEELFIFLTYYSVTGVGRKFVMSVRKQLALIWTGIDCVMRSSKHRYDTMIVDPRLFYRDSKSTVPIQEKENINCAPTPQSRCPSNPNLSAMPMKNPDDRNPTRNEAVPKKKRKPAAFTFNSRR